MTNLTTADGLTLQLRTWEASGPSRGQVLIVHGLGEHAGRYTALASALANEGWQVGAYDQRGHGSSQGARGVIAVNDSLLGDLAAVIDRVRASGSGPLILLGHSLGGLVVGRFVAELLKPQPAPWSRFVDGLVMSSPALDAGMSLAQRALVSVASALVPGLPVNNGLDPDWICSDPAVVQAYRRDPLVHDRICGRLARFIRDEGPQVLAAARLWSLPTLLMWAGADRCVSPAGSARFVREATDCVTGREWPGLAHEIFNEPERGLVTDVLLDWLRGRDF